METGGNRVPFCETGDGSMNGSLRERKSSEGVLDRGVVSSGAVTKGVCNTEENYPISNNRTHVSRDLL